jgi:shikimate kinase
MSKHYTTIDARDRIYLVGFMGAGKTTRGREMADLLRYAFVDLDHLVEEEVGMSIPEIFLIKGESFFRECEMRMLKRTQILGRTVIATGGGTASIPGAMQWMNRNGWTVYLKVGWPELKSRLLAIRESRPLIAGDNWEADTEKLWSNRLPDYLQARQILLPDEEWSPLT